jgi:multiple sugar transport system substrate-binding protein
MSQVVSTRDVPGDGRPASAASAGPERASPSRRRFLAGAAGLAGSALALGAAACGESPTASAPDRAAQGLPPAQLAVWMWWPDPLESVQQMGGNFARIAPQIKMEPEVATPAYWDKVQASLAGGSGPDIFLMNNVNYRVFANRGALVDLTKRLPADANGRDYLKQAWQPGLKFYDYKGKTMGAAVMLTSIVTLYNETAVKNAGLKTPAELGTDWNWDRLQEYALKLNSTSGERPVYGTFSTGGIEQGWLNFVWANGGDYLSADETRCVVDQRPSEAAFEYLAGLALRHRVSPPADVLRNEPVQTLFSTGRLIFWPAASNVIKIYKAQLDNATFQWNYALIPTSPETKRSGGTTNITGWVLNKDGKAIDQSWAALSYMLTKEAQDIIARANVLRPAREDSAQIYYDPATMGGPANRRAALEMFKWTRPLPTHDKVTWTETQTPTTKWVNDIFAGTVSVKDGLRQIAAEVNALFAKAGA